jgi:ATP-dependent exoDNAse (exonuclease V) beta subunit
LKAFLNLWENPEEKREDFQVVLPEYTDAIKVLTIHKAKGLGFPVVISPFTYLENKPVEEVYERKGSGCLVSYRLNKDQAGASARLRELYRKKFTCQLIDELNTFYVCVTRAQDELYIFLPNYKSKTGKLEPPIFFEGPVFEVGTPLVRSPKAVQEKERRIHPPLINEWQDKLHRPGIDMNELVDTARKRAKERGILIHNFLARIERLSNRWADELEEMFGTLSEKEREIVPLIRDFFEREDLREWFLLPADVDVCSEKEIVDEKGLGHRVDRVLVTSCKVVVIEFKSGEPRSQKDREQVAAYLNLLSGIYPERTIEGWLVYVDEVSQEKVEEILNP